MNNILKEYKKVNNFSQRVEKGEEKKVAFKTGFLEYDSLTRE